MAETKQTGVAERQQTAEILNNKLIDQISGIIQVKEESGFVIPPNYNHTNALNSAYLILQETVDKDGKNAIQNCTHQSVMSSLLDMVVQGLSPAKKQCYFVAYGGKLKLIRSYQGAMAVAKRVGAKLINAEVIYEGDEFEYHIENGIKIMDKHNQNFLSIDNSKIKGAYCVITMEDGTKYLEVMNMAQIKQAWSMSKSGQTVHNSFTDQMAKKTVINRACKNIINSSDDSYLNEMEHTKDEDDLDIVDDIVQEDIKTNASSVDFDDIETVEDAKVVQKKETKTQAVQQSLDVDSEY